jgi:hypothetical protein
MFNWFYGQNVQAVEFVQMHEPRDDAFSGLLVPVEYGYYLVIFYLVLGGPLGLILPGAIGAGFLLVPVLALCLVALGPLVLTVFQTAWIPVACGMSYLFIQLAVHGESLKAHYVYDFGPWLISVIIVQSLALFRSNFLHRFALFALAMGLSMLPFMTLGEERASLESGVGFSNANAMAAWFGFCVLYLIIRGYVETRLAYRLTAWFIAIGCLYVVTLTVSRGAVIAITASLLVTSRQLLKIGLFPVLILAGLLWGFLEFGVFDQAIRSYTHRGAEDTGRLQVWPLLIEQFIDSPFIGNGASHAGAFTSPGKYRTPHNSFLLLGVASGIVPLVLFSAYCFRSARAALRANTADQDSMFYLPLVVYTVLITNSGNLDFMMPWAIVSLGVPLGTTVHQMQRDNKKYSSY